MTDCFFEVVIYFGGFNFLLSNLKHPFAKASIHRDNVLSFW